MVSEENRGFDTLKQFEHDYNCPIGELETKVLQFVVESTKIFDDSHDYRHALIVANNALLMYKKFKDNNGDNGEYNGLNKLCIAYNDVNISKYILYLALLHDVCDHKYSESISRDKLTEFVRDNITGNFYAHLNDLIDMVSYSRQLMMEQGLNDSELEKLEKYHIIDKFVLDIVRSADRQEAIGEIGVERVRLFSINKRKSKTKMEIDIEIVYHGFEKLLRLVPENYINKIFHTDEIIRRHNYCIDYIKKIIQDYSLIGKNILVETGKVKPDFGKYYDIALLNKL